MKKSENLEDVLTIIRKDLDLKKEEENEIISRFEKELQRKFTSVLEGVRAQLPKKITRTNESILIPQFDIKTYSIESTKYFRSSEISDYLLENYPKSEEIELIFASSSGSLASSAIAESVGKNLYQHALSPWQADCAIEKIKSELLEKKEDETEDQYILFLKGRTERQATRELNKEFDSRAVILVSANMRTYIALDKKRFRCDPVFIGIENADRDGYGGYNLTGPWNAKFLLNKSLE